MATIRKRGGKFQAIVRRGHHSQAKTFSKRADTEHWAKMSEIEIERNVSALPNSADGITFSELITSYKKRCTILCRIVLSAINDNYVSVLRLFIV